MHGSLLVVAVTWCACGATQELTVSGDFGGLEDWSYIDADDGEGSLSLDEGRDGGTCAKVECTRADGRWGPGVGQTGAVAVEAGKWYELRFWAKQEGIAPGIIAALRDTRDWSNLLWQHVYPTSEWREFALTFDAQKALAKADSRLQFSFDTTGTLWIDQVSLREIARPRSPNVIDMGDVKNRVPNSSFEVGTYGWGTYGTTFLVGNLDETTAYHGSRSFRLDISPDSVPIHWNDFTYAQRGKPTHARPTSVSLVTHGYLPVTPGETMVVSAYVKADKPGGQVRLGLTEETGADRRNSIDVGTEWTRVVVPVEPQAEAAFVRIELLPGEGADPPTTLWVDAVQLEAGGPTEYEPALPVEVGFETGRVGDVCYVDEPAEVSVRAHNASGAPKQLDLSVVWESFGRDLTEADPLSLTIPTHTTETARIPLPRGGPGFHRLRVTWEDEAAPQERRLRLAVLHPLADEYAGRDTFLGQNHSFVTDRLMTLTRDAGTSWVRSWFVRWDDIEPEKGRFDFAEADAQLDRLERLGFSVQFVLGDPTSEWASTAPADLNESTGAEAESQRVWWMPEDMQAYEGYVAALMERYGDRVQHWEILNEPVNRKGGPECNLRLEETYIEFIGAARRAAESSGKDVQLMGAGLHYLEGMDNTGSVLGALDILSEHRYPGLGSAHGFQSSIRGAARTFAQHGGSRPVWITEYGIYADDDPDPTTLHSRFLVHAGEDSEMLAAIATVKHQVVALANGADKVFFHIGNWPITLNREHGCGFHPFFEWGGLPRKMLVAQNTLSYALPPGFEVVGALSDTPPVMAYEFSTERGATFIFWAEGSVELPVALRRSMERKQVRVCDVEGGVLRTVETINEEPIYATARGGAAGEVRSALRTLATQAQSAP